MYNMGYCIEANMYGQNNITTGVPQYKNITMHDIYCENAIYGWLLRGLNNSAIQINLYNIQLLNVKEMYLDCENAYGTCDNSTVLPSCPPCVGSTVCKDMSSDCSNYLGLCNNAAYRKL